MFLLILCTAFYGFTNEDETEPQILNYDIYLEGKKRDSKSMDFADLQDQRGYKVTTRSKIKGGVKKMSCHFAVLHFLSFEFS